MWGYDIEDEEDKNFKEEREYKFFVYGEPEIEVVVGGLKTTLPISKLGLSYYKSKMETDYDSFGGSTSLVNKLVEIESQDIELLLLTIRGTSNSKYDRYRIYEDLVDFKDFTVEVGPYLEEYKVQKGPALNICYKETQYSTRSEPIRNFADVLKLFNLG